MTSRGRPRARGRHASLGTERRKRWRGACPRIAGVAAGGRAEHGTAATSGGCSKRRDSAIRLEHHVEAARLCEWGLRGRFFIPMARRSNVKQEDAQALYQSLVWVKKRTLIGMFTDNTMLDKLVLKGASALELVHGISNRGSIDLDFSMSGDFTEDLRKTQDRLESALKLSFDDEGYLAFDFKFTHKPPVMSDDLKAFWGGYHLGFKIISKDKAAALDHELEDLRRNALIVGPSQRRVFEVEISPHEYCEIKQSARIDNYTIYAYPPRLIVCEKLRAICQQMPEYQPIVHRTSARPRAKDFLDIYTIVHEFSIQTSTPEFLDLLREVLKAKRVPEDLVWKIAAEDTRAFHKDDFESVRNTVLNPDSLLTFDDYFNFVASLVKGLKPLGT